MNICSDTQGDDMAHKKAKLMDQDGCRVRVVHLERVKQAQEDAISDNEMKRLSATFKILGDPTRLKIVMALLNREMCVCDLAAFVQTSESAVSHQLRRLKDLNLVRQRRDGQVLYNALDDDHVAGLLGIGLEHIRESQ
jgi:ArsR family transcriptional regulator, lead/cadmium/zinc/bismuth-responsive transcriptional repressor